ncbi:hypothetical protein [Cytobacillus firmus]|nr:hypothetical protein [Cytobacillus firmus]
MHRVFYWIWLIGEMMKYGNEGLKLMIAIGWMVNPPESEDRTSFYKLDK